MTKSRNIGRGGQNKIDLKGQVFGRLTVIQDYGRKDRKILWLCECRCGNKVIIGSSRLINKVTRSCGCLHKEEVFKRLWKGYGNISLTYWNSVVLSAKRRGITFNITIEEAWDLFLKQDKKCILSGLDIELSFSMTGEGRKIQTASIDRKDNHKGYTIDNIQWVHKDVNAMKSNFDETYFIEMCTNICKNKEKTQ